MPTSNNQNQLQLTGEPSNSTEPDQFDYDKFDRRTSLMSVINSEDDGPVETEGYGFSQAEVTTLIHELSETIENAIEHVKRRELSSLIATLARASNDFFAQLYLKKGHAKFINAYIVIFSEIIKFVHRNINLSEENYSDRLTRDDSIYFSCIVKDNIETFYDFRNNQMNLHQDEREAFAKLFIIHPLVANLLPIPAEALAQPTFKNATLPLSEEEKSTIQQEINANILTGPADAETLAEIESQLNEIHSNLLNKFHGCWFKLFNADILSKVFIVSKLICDFRKTPNLNQLDNILNDAIQCDGLTRHRNWLCRSLPQCFFKPPRTVRQITELQRDIYQRTPSLRRVGLALTL